MMNGDVHQKYLIYLFHHGKDWELSLSTFCHMFKERPSNIEKNQIYFFCEKPLPKQFEP